MTVDTLTILALFLLTGVICQDSSINSNTINVYSIQKQPQIFINQSDNQVIQATYGQTVALPCLVYRETNQELSNVNLKNKKIKRFFLYNN